MGATRDRVKESLRGILERYKVTGDDHSARFESMMRAMDKASDPDRAVVKCTENLLDCCENIDKGDLRTAMRVWALAHEYKNRSVYSWPTESINYAAMIAQNSLEGKLFS